MRRFLLMAAAVLALTGCGSDKTKTVTVPGPASTVTVTAPATTPATTTETQPSSGTYRKPKPGEGRVTVTGNVANGETRRLPGTGDTSVYTYFVLQPADGGPALRVGAAGDLNLDPKVRAALVDPRCGGKLRGTFTVGAAPKRETAFDWELVSARLLNNCSRA